jgi:Zn-dependent membrane protease YugP
MSPAFVIALAAQINVKRTFAKYGGVRSRRGTTGAQAARRILDRNGLGRIGINHISGELTDNYDPSAGEVNLSDSVYDSDSVAAIGVAAHETGHAVQHSVGYAPLKLRNAIIPVTQISSSLSMWLVLLGLLVSWLPIAYFGIILFSAAVFFQLVTLPVEFNASSRALKTLESDYMLDEDELKGARRVLKAAALTYVAATVVAFLQLFRLISLVNSRRD